MALQKQPAQIGREQAQTEELSNYFEVLTFFKNPPESESDRVIPKSSKKTAIKQ